MAYVDGVEIDGTFLRKAVDNFLAKHNLRQPLEVICWLDWNTTEHTEEATDGVRLYRHLMSITPEKWWTTSMALLLVDAQRVGVLKFGDNLPLGNGDADSAIALRYAAISDEAGPSISWYEREDIVANPKDQLLFLGKPINLSGALPVGLDADQSINAKMIARTINRTTDLSDPEAIITAMLDGTVFTSEELQRISTAKGYLIEFMDALERLGKGDQAALAQRIATLQAPMMNAKVAEWLQQGMADDEFGMADVSSRRFYVSSVIAGFICVSTIIYYNWVDSSGWSLAIAGISLIAWVIAVVLCRLARSTQWRLLLQQDRQAVVRHELDWQARGSAERYRRQGRIVRWLTAATVVAIGFIYIGDGAYHHADLAHVNSLDSYSQYKESRRGVTPKYADYVEYIPEGRWQHILGWTLGADGDNWPLFHRSSTREPPTYNPGNTYFRAAEYSNPTYGSLDLPLARGLYDLYVKPLLYKRGYDFDTVEVNGVRQSVTYKVGPFIESKGTTISSDAR